LLGGGVQRGSSTLLLGGSHRSRHGPTSPSSC
jgi:hypothetical protein